MKKTALSVLCFSMLVTAQSAFAAMGISNPIASNDSLNSTYQYNYSGTPLYFRVYIDTDRVSTTGYPNGGIGAEYLIENKVLYKYAGLNGSWKWTKVGAITSGSNTNGIVKYTVLRTAIGETLATGEGSDLVYEVGNNTTDKALPKFTQNYNGSTPTPDPTPTPTGIWQPHPGLSWQMQISNDVDTSFNVQVYDIDLFETPKSKIDSLHSRGIKVVCYFSAGTSEDWRPDYSSFPASVKGNLDQGWPGENWLDIRQLSILMPIMKARLDMAKQKGCDAVDPDNIDGFQAPGGSGFPLTANDQLVYNRTLVKEAHGRGMGIGMKNDVGQVKDLVTDFDFAVNEECFDYKECDQLKPFIDANKAVVQIEYKLTIDQFCPQANAMNFDSLLKHRSLDAYRVSCR